VTSEPAIEEPEPPTEQETHMVDLVVALIGAVVVSSSGYYAMRLGDRTVTRALRVALWCIIGGLSLYVIYVLGLTYLGSESGSGGRAIGQGGLGFLDGRGGVWMAGGAAFVGSVVTLLMAWLFDRRRRPKVGLGGKA
jgi:hypothetical protein